LAAGEVATPNIRREWPVCRRYTK